MTEFIPGRTYVLSRDVRNPHLDRRNRYRIEEAEWQAGDRWTYMQVGVLRCVHSKALKGRQSYQTLHATHPGYTALANALVLQPESMADAMREVGGDFPPDEDDVLRKLYATGVITRAQLQEAVRQCMADIDAKEDA